MNDLSYNFNMRNFSSFYFGGIPPPLPSFASK